MALAGGVGWLWWRAAYGPMDFQSLAEWWRSTGGKDAAVEDLVMDDEPARPAETPKRDDARVVPVPPPPEVLVFPSNGVSAVSRVGVSVPGAGATGGPPAVLTWEPPSVNDVRPGKESTNVMAVQLALARRGISSGPIDGVVGSQTRAALRVFQKQEGLAVTGWMDERTVTRLGAVSQALTNYVVTAEDLARLTWVPSTWQGKSTRERLDYENVLELVAEKSHSHPRLLRQLNPKVDWYRVSAGTPIAVPAVALPPLRGRAGFVRISLSEKALRVFDPSSNLVAHFPCSIARKVEKRPVGELKVVRLAPNPNYRFDPEIFPESPEARRIGRKLMIPPGPNNPVGTAWIGLSRSGYGIHGTPHPEDVGRTESHGCFRLANWNAEFLIRAAWVGMPVIVEP